MTVSATRLIGLIAEIDEALEKPGGAARAIRSLCESEGASHQFKSGTYELKLAGVKATCTAGSHGLLRNWQQAARRRVRDLGAKA